MAQHKWHDEIVAWAEGAIIQSPNLLGEWIDIHNPSFYSDADYRIKPQPKEPQYLYVWLDKDTELAQLETHEPKGVLEDDLYKYIGKIKLENDNGND
jgi:hypothetical protein